MQAVGKCKVAGADGNCQINAAMHFNTVKININKKNKSNDL
jgi:hypothetical protein